MTIPYSPEFAEMESNPSLLERLRAMTGGKAYRDNADVLEEAARNLGASRIRAFLWVTLPQLRPGLLAGGIFVFVEAIDNFSIAVFLTNSRTTTLPVESYSYIRDFDDPTVAAMAVLLMALSVVLVFAIDRLVGLDRFLELK